MIARLVAIIFIYICTAIAWMILGATIQHRENTSDSSLRGRVATTWGTTQQQQAPTASFTVPRQVTIDVVENGKTVKRQDIINETFLLPLEGSNINAALDLDHRRKGLRWYATYKVAFDGAYQFVNSSGKDVDARFTLQYPSSQAIFDDMQVTIDGQPATFVNEKTYASAAARVKAGATATVRWAYKSQGLEQWNYTFGAGDVAQVKNFQMKLTTNFKDIDFPDNTLSPTDKAETPNGWNLTWNYRNLVSGFQIAMVMPEKLQPGPLAGQIAYFAPVSLFFFFFILLVITTIRNIELHPMNYFFLAGAFFAFHLLMAYLVDHIDIHAAFLISAIVSIFLVVSYLRLVVGLRFAAMEAAGAQFLYLVLFSYAFFFKGFTGLSVTIGSIVTLFAVMQLTGRINWAEKFARTPATFRRPGPPSLNPDPSSAS